MKASILIKSDFIGIVNEINVALICFGMCTRRIRFSSSSYEQMSLARSMPFTLTVRLEASVGVHINGYRLHFRNCKMMLI